MDCSRFEEWLDRGRPRSVAPDALAHAESCGRCSEELEAARALDDVLTQRFASAPASFTDRVLERLPRRATEDPIVTLADGDPMLPWWVGALLEPPVLGALALASVLFLWGPSLRAAGADLLAAIASGAFPGPSLGTLLSPGTPVMVTAALSAATLFTAAGAVYLVYRAGVSLGSFLFSRLLA